MRRTYRSKKDTGGVLDRRDLLQNLDEKSSAYDAFFIQNIKQTKRELSCVGSSNAHGIASNRVRKRKYVKRIIKEVETPCRESLSRSAYLTPDKSIRVNKPMDPFDMLLNSSNACTVEVRPKTESVTSKVDLFDKLVNKNEGKTYTRRKPVKPKKVNYSDSVTSNSDKENSDENITRNTSDIKAYQLLIENEANTTPKRCNDSINNIVNNISLLNKLKYKNSFNDSMKKPLSYYKHRLTRNIQSPILQKSPLCSTPFKAKYRGESIFKFSPISITNDDNSPKFTTITEDNDNSNNSIVFLGNNKTQRHIDSKENAQMSVVDIVPNNSTKCDLENEGLTPETETNAEEVFHRDSTIQEKKSTEIVSKSNATSSVEISTLQTTEVEPFLGFPNNANREIITGDISLHRISDLDEIETRNDITEIEVNENENSGIIEEDRQYNFSAEFNNMKEDNNSLSEYENDEKDSFYDTCNSEQNSIEEKEVIKEPIVKIRRMNDSSFLRYYENMKDFGSEGNETHESLKDEDTDDCNDSLVDEVIDDTNMSLQDKEINENNASTDEEICESNMSRDDEISKKYVSEEEEGIQENNVSQEDEVLSQDDECNDSLVDKVIDDSNTSLQDKEIYENSTTTDEEIDESNTSRDDEIYKNYVNEKVDAIQENDVSQEDEVLSRDDEFISFEDSTASTEQTSENGSSSSVNVDNYLIENEASEYIDIVSSNDDDEESNLEEKCVSFVTTRRRNEVANNSMISIFNDSFASSSTDCDKTVLSNSRKTDNENNKKIIDENETLINLNQEKQVDSDDEVLELRKDVEDEEILIPNLPNCEEKEDTRISFVTTRNSNITERKSSIRNRKSSIKPSRNTVSNRRSSNLPRESTRHSPEPSRKTLFEKPGIVLQPGKKWERSLSIFRRITMMTDHFDQSILEDEPTEKKGRKYRQSVIETMERQELNGITDWHIANKNKYTKIWNKLDTSIQSFSVMSGSLHNESINSRRSTFVSKPCRFTIRIVKDPDISRLSLCNTSVFDDLKGFLNEECDDTIIELSKLSIADQTHEVTVLDTFHDTSSRIATARDYVLRRCSQTDAILFDECYPDTVLKNCHKIGEGVYGEVFLWRARDGRARVLKIVPIAGTLKVNGESQKDFHEIISEIVIAMELSALRAPIAEINRHLDEGKDVAALDLHAIENATDIFNEVLAVRCVYGSYPARLLDLWDLYDECKGSENDNPAILPADQQFIVLELANAGQDLESYQFNNAEQAYALFMQVAYGLAVAEEAFQFEHRDLHWGNVLIAPTEQKYSTFVLRGRSHLVPRCGVAATIIDYSLSRVSLPLAGGECAALYNDLASDDSLFDAVGDYQFEVYRLMRDKLGNDWKNFAPYTNILWLHYTVDKMITALRYKRTNTKIHKHYIDKLKGIKGRILDYGSAALFVLTDNEI